MIISTFVSYVGVDPSQTGTTLLEFFLQLEKMRNRDALSNRIKFFIMNSLLFNALIVNIRIPLNQQSMHVKQ